MSGLVRRAHRPWLAAQSSAPNHIECGGIRRRQASRTFPSTVRMIVLGFAFAASWTVVTAMAVHLPRLLEAAGARSVQAVAAGALIGPAGGRPDLGGELNQRLPSDVVRPALGRAASYGCRGLRAVRAAAASAPFTILHGAGSGILTIARGTVPLAMFGPENYGYRLGLLGAPSRVAMAAAPLLFGILIDRYGSGVLIFSSALSIAAFAGLCSLSISQAART